MTPSVVDCFMTHLFTKCSEVALKARDRRHFCEKTGMCECETSELTELLGVVGLGLGVIWTSKPSAAQRLIKWKADFALEVSEGALAMISPRPQTESGFSLD